MTSNQFEKIISFDYFENYITMPACCERYQRGLHHQNHGFGSILTLVYFMNAKQTTSLPNMSSI